MTSRSTLLRLLTEACELEHALACSYLYSAMSLKQAPDGDRLTAEQMPLVWQWAAQLYFVASQEMLHLAQAWNLITALGGTPYYLRPNFPQTSKYYPLHLRLALEPYGERSLERFIAYERPAELAPEHAWVAQLTAPRAADGDTFRTVGELYELIERGVLDLRGAIIGDPNAQVGQDLVDFPDIVKVVDVESAQRAIEVVRHQGEGNKTDRADCHFGIFTELYRAFLAEKDRSASFEPAHPAILNPTVDNSQAYGAPDANLIKNAYTKEAAQCFDGLYSLMLRMLGYTFNADGDPVLRRSFGKDAIVMMATVLKPLGEALTQLPVADHGSRVTAGPPFGLTRHVMLPTDARAARALVSERLAELTATISTLTAATDSVPAMRRAEAMLRRISDGSWFGEPPRGESRRSLASADS